MMRKMKSTSCHYFFKFPLRSHQGHATDQVVSCWPLITQSQVSVQRICGGQSGHGTSFPLSTLIFPCQYHSLSAACSLLYPPMLHNLGNWQHCYISVHCSYWSAVYSMRFLM